MNIITNLLNSRARRKTILWTAVILVIAVVLLIVFNFLFSSSTSFSRLLNWSDPDKYQAVFLSNGQVYFGKVTDINLQTLVLEDIYYLRMSQALQASSLGEETGQVSADNFSLIKLGNEIHGPENKMNINLDHVLFIENLSNDSKVVEAIREYKSRE